MDKKERLMALKEVRDRTQAALIECKNALEETKGDIEQAIEDIYLRVQKKAYKYEKRNPTKKFVFGGTNNENTKGVIFTLSCETDFVGSSREYKRLAQEMKEIALSMDIEEKSHLLKEKKGKLTIQEQINFWMVTFGENIVLIDLAFLRGENIVFYGHTGDRIGSLISTSSTESEAIKEGANIVAAQVALMKPMAIDEAGIREKFKSQDNSKVDIASLAKKRALLQQPLFQDEDKSVAEYMNSLEPNFKIKQFIRMPRG